MFSPIFRDSPSPFSFPCGGSSQSDPHLLTEPQQFEPVVWDVISPDYSGNCSLRLSSNSDFSIYTILKPSLFNSTYFQCGRTTGIESYLFQIPGRYLCKDCVFQLIWETSKGLQYHCADIVIALGINNCGENCNEVLEENTQIDVFFYVKVFLICSLFISVFFLVVYLYFHQEKLPRKVLAFLSRNAKWALRFDPVLEFD